MTSLIRRVAGTERRDSLSNPSAELVEALTHGQFGPSYTGKTVTPKNALALVAVFSCVDLLSRTVGSLPCHLYRTDGDGTPTEVTGTPLAELLSREANVEHAGGDLFELAMVHLLLHGNAYLWKERDRLGRVSALWPILPSRVRVGRDTNGLKIFEVQNPQAGGIAAGTARDILHIRGMGVDGLVGLSPIEMARQALGIYGAHEEYQGRFYASNASPGGYITLGPNRTLDSEGVKELKANWNGAHRGLPAAGKIGVLQDGQTFTPVSISMADQQFIDQQHFSIAQVCNLFRVPQWMLGEATGNSLTYATVEQQGEFFATYSISTWCHRIERSLRLDGDLFIDPALYPKFNMDALLRADLLARYKAYTFGVDAGILGRSEVRALEDMPPAPSSVPEFGPLPGAKPPATRAQDILLDTGVIGSGAE